MQLVLLCIKDQARQGGRSHGEDLALPPVDKDCGLRGAGNTQARVRERGEQPTIQFGEGLVAPLTHIREEVRTKYEIPNDVLIILLCVLYKHSA